jgi:hypothetical protein
MARSGGPYFFAGWLEAGWHFLPWGLHWSCTAIALQHLFQCNPDSRASAVCMPYAKVSAGCAQYLSGLQAGIWELQRSIISKFPTTLLLFFYNSVIYSAVYLAFAIHYDVLCFTHKKAPPSLAGLYLIL